MLAGASAAGLAAGLSGALVLGQTTDTTARYDVSLAATVIGVGGRDDPTSTRLRDKLGGDYALGYENGVFTPASIQYPASLAFQSSIDDGVPKLAQAVVDAKGRIRIVAYSEGTLVAEQVKRNLANSTSTDPAPPSPDNLDFVFLASPYLPNGGIFARFPGLRIPGLLPEFSAAQPTKYGSTYVTNEYDGFADFPAYFNPLSIANALLGMAYAHPDQYYDGIHLDDLVEGQTKFTSTGLNAAGGRDAYVLVYNPHLPLFAPIRQVAALLLLTPLTEPVLGAIEPLVRVAVDMGYTDRTNANAATATPFSFTTPPSNVVEATGALPGAVRQGATDSLAGEPATTLKDPTSTDPAAGKQPEEPVVGNRKAALDPASKTKVEPVEPTPHEPLRGQITHPTLTSDGNPSRPGTTAGSTPSAGGGQTETPTTVSEPGAVPDGPTTSVGAPDGDGGAEAGAAAAA